MVYTYPYKHLLAADVVFAFVNLLDITLPIPGYSLHLSCDIHKYIYTFVMNEERHTYNVCTVCAPT